VIEEAVSEQQSVPASPEGHNGKNAKDGLTAARHHRLLYLQSAD
jgi:hypothetical protein